MFTLTPKLSASLALASLVYSAVFPQAGLVGDNLANELAPDNTLTTIQGQALVQTANPNTPMVVSSQWVLVTAYSSTPDQTDSTPFITALGTHVRDGIVACNFLPFGTQVRINGKTYVVEDRMAKRNSHKIDIWFPSRWAALQFGARTLKVEVLAG